MDKMTNEEFVKRKRVGATIIRPDEALAAYAELTSRLNAFFSEQYSAGQR
jgi:hypothetical protein